ncbi:MAG: hypothetical protein Q9208_005754 [Pyrenodesmia sp. 3 TL-2023]
MILAFMAAANVAVATPVPVDPKAGNVLAPELKPRQSQPTQDFALPHARAKRDPQDPDGRGSGYQPTYLKRDPQDPDGRGSGYQTTSLKRDPQDPDGRGSGYQTTALKRDPQDPDGRGSGYQTTALKRDPQDPDGRGSGYQTTALKRDPQDPDKRTIEKLSRFAKPLDDFRFLYGSAVGSKD